MLGQTNQTFALADLAFRREQISADLARARRPLALGWPFGLTSGRRRRPRFASRPMPSPHHATSH
jgi:hypothetical protein